MNRRRVWLTVLVAALCLDGEIGAALAQGMPPLVEIRVESISAHMPGANQPRTPPSQMDKRLENAAVGQRLLSMFDFTNYRLIKNQHESTRCGEPVAFNLPGGHILHIEPFETDDNDLAISVMLFEGAHPIMQMPFRTELHSMLFLVDQHYQDSLYITAISVESLLLHHQHQHPPGPMAPAPPITASPALVPAE
jgi:hypothetical protein